MLQAGAIVNDQPKSISAARPKKPGPHSRAKNNRGGANVQWKRITAAFDDHLQKLGANPAMTAPATRWVLFKHLTRTQGMAARRYADIVRAFERYFSEGGARSPRSANLEPVRKPSDDVLHRELMNGTIADYEADARKAKRQYHRLMKVLGKYADPVTGRNFAKDHLDLLCLEEKEPEAQFRGDIANVLSAVAKEFGLGEKRRKITGGAV
jgi:hypothetical protein